MKVIRRALAVATIGVLMSLGFALPAEAQTGACSTTSLAPGQTITVSGSGAGAGNTVQLRFQGNVIGATTANGFGNFTVSGPIPDGTPPGVYAIRFTIPGNPGNPFFACNVTVQNLPPTPAPTPTPAPVTPAPADDDDDDGPGGGNITQEQNQEQTINFPIPVVAAPHYYAPRGGGGGGGSSLPKTGVDAAEVGGIGTASLLVGVSLMEFARRRRRHWLTPASVTPAAAATSVAVQEREPVAEPMVADEVPQIVPSEPLRHGQSEGDLLLTYVDGDTVRLEGPGDFLTPGF